MSKYIKKQYPKEHYIPYTNPEIITHWDYSRNTEDPNFLSSGMNKDVFLTQKCGHYWSVNLSNQSRKNKVDCPYCLNKRLLKGFNDLSSQRPDLVKEIDTMIHPDLDPTEIIIVSIEKISWVSEECGHIWIASINSRYYGNNCPYCSSQMVLVGFNDFESLRPHLVKEWSSLNKKKPSEYTKTSGQSVWWDGVCGHVWKTAINNRVAGKGCPYCSNRKVLAGLNDLLSVSEIAGKDWDRANNDKPSTEILFSTRSSGYFLCVENHLILEGIELRVLRGSCRTCAKSTSRLEEEVFSAIIGKYPNIKLRKHFRFETENGRRLEIDILFEELNFGIEVQDFWSHSRTSDDEFFCFGPMRGPTYHKNKIDKAKSIIGVDIVEIWEDEINDSNFLKIFAEIDLRLSAQ